MGRLIMITGGARSGKSTFAEKLAAKASSVLYVATSIPFDDEMKDRVKKHRERRPAHWNTYEGYKGLKKVIAEADKEVVLLDCMTVMIANLLMDEGGDWDKIPLSSVDEIERGIEQEVVGIVEGARDSKAMVIVVSNEVGMGLVPEYRLGRVFRDIAGRMNQLVAADADEVYLMVSGIPVKIK
ncbi:bifunctional adenosylcobinamide kinase/adenosylcobinamide-phosphate guanylyltransferase [Caldanaerobius polysaccharolyticus]|uniref:bifunctional adenosylcobinamide kinase/adenosylcobinamide-phosphate guanylyltransferase n=1 Tax=Caldanaerobius polysaccharolyticus TaxID=44256 RepID=UPI00047BB0AD|nr:bifunctional adenosylcobinamide kinase/adenosylcobinamide-phosphate guanylyltransferase [Caldanaerobius polysaccharolyticus]